MGFLGIGNNPMVGCTVAVAVDVADCPQQVIEYISILTETSFRGCLFLCCEIKCRSVILSGYYFKMTH